MEYKVYISYQIQKLTGKLSPRSLVRLGGSMAKFSATPLIPSKAPSIQISRKDVLSSLRQSGDIIFQKISNPSSDLSLAPTILVRRQPKGLQMGDIQPHYRPWRQNCWDFLDEILYPSPARKQIIELILVENEFFKVITVSLQPTGNTAGLDRLVETLEGIVSTSTEIPSSSSSSSSHAAPSATNFSHQVILAAPLNWTALEEKNIELSIINQLKEAFEPWTFPEIAQHADDLRPRGILLYGPPGTGKTLLMRSLPLVDPQNKICILNPSQPITAGRFFRSEVGHTQMELKKEAEICQHQQYRDKLCLLLMDEIDTIGRSRGKSKQEAFRADFVNALLTLFDNALYPNLFIIGTTNLKGELDEALLRPGRMGVHIYLGPLTLSQRLPYLLPMSTVTKDQFHQFAALTTNMTRAQILQPSGRFIYMDQDHAFESFRLRLATFIKSSTETNLKWNRMLLDSMAIERSLLKITQEQIFHLIHGHAEYPRASGTMTGLFLLSTNPTNPSFTMELSTGIISRYPDGPLMLQPTISLPSHEIHGTSAQIAFQMLQPLVSCFHYDNVDIVDSESFNSHRSNELSDFLRAKTETAKFGKTLLVIFVDHLVGSYHTHDRAIQEAFQIGDVIDQQANDTLRQTIDNSLTESRQRNVNNTMSISNSHQTQRSSTVSINRQHARNTTRQRNGESIQAQIGVNEQQNSTLNIGNVYSRSDSIAAMQALSEDIRFSSSLCADTSFSTSQTKQLMSNTNYMISSNLRFAHEQNLLELQEFLVSHRNFPSSNTEKLIHPPASAGIKWEWNTDPDCAGPAHQEPQSVLPAQEFSKCFHIAMVVRDPATQKMLLQGIDWGDQRDSSRHNSIAFFRSELDDQFSMAQKVGSYWPGLGVHLQQIKQVNIFDIFDLKQHQALRRLIELIERLDPSQRPTIHYKVT